MSAVAKSNQSRLDFRVQREQKSLIERAARLEGRTITDYAVATLVKAAQEAVQRAGITTLSARDGKVFLQMLDSASSPKATLKAAAKRYRKSRV